MSDNNPLVSIIIPTYNRASLLKEAIKSCYDQNYRPIECVIVDDGSTDNTKEVVSNFTEIIDESFKVKYIYQQNSGAQVARNIGLKESSGKYIQYFDSDDLLNTEKLKKQVIFLESKGDVDGVYGDFRKGNPENNETIKAMESGDLFKQFLIKQSAPTFSILLRRDYVDKIGDWDITLNRFQDIDFHLRGLLMGGKYKYIPMETGLWRTHDNSRVTTRQDLNDILVYFKKWERILVSKNLFTAQIRNYFSNVYFGMATAEKLKGKELRNFILRESVRLNPKINFINTSKMKFLRNAFGLKFSITMWLVRSKWTKINLV